MDTADSDLPDAAVEHISKMLTLAKCKHQEAMALLGTPDPNALPRLREVLRLTVASPSMTTVSLTRQTVDSTARALATSTDSTVTAA